MEKEIKKILLKKNIKEKGKINEGGFGKIYYGTVNGNEVIIKIQIPNDQEREKQIKEECYLSKKLNSKNIVKTYSVYNDKLNNKNMYSIVMEKSYYNDMQFFLDYLFKKNLLKIINFTKNFSYLYTINNTLLSFFLIQIFEGLKIFHELNFVHRDIKPENILVANYFIIKLCDFGITKKASNEFEVGSGTKNYQGPECYSDNNIITNKNDCFKVDYFPIGLLIYICYFKNNPINQNFKDRNDLEGLNNCLNKACQKISEYQFDENDTEEVEIKHFDNNLKECKKVKIIPKKIGLLAKKLLEKNISDRPNIFELLDNEELNNKKKIINKIYNINRFSGVKCLIEMQKPILKLKKRNKKFNI